jgi:hypothetical protein
MIMKGKITQYATRATALAALLITAGLFGNAAYAQAARAGFYGKFTLPYATQWGNATLQPGDYLLTFNGDGTLLVIRDAKSQRTVAFEPISDSEDCGKGGSALVISATGEQHVVRSLRISELGEAYVYSHASAREVEEARHTRTVPVVVAKK